MRSQLGVTMMIAALGAVAVCACSSSSSGSQADAGPTACSAALNDLLSASPGPACPFDANGQPSVYDDAITTTCSTLKMNTGDVQYGQCFDYLVWQVDVDSSGHNFSKCFYDVSTHALVGVIYADGTQDQCGGTSFTVQAGQVDTTCSVTPAGGGGGFHSCAPVSDAGGGG
jgi:hypothetical protein